MRVPRVPEATLLAIVAILAAYSGYASAKWGTEQSLTLARAATARTESSRAEFEVAFQAWLASDPEHNPDAPKGPTYMDEYLQPDLDRAIGLDQQADDLYHEGASAGSTADGYVRTTVFLASVLFLVGISGHFRVRSARYGLVAVGSAILLVSIYLLATAPAPPG